MEFSPRRQRLHRKLYRNGVFAVTLAAAICLAGSWLVGQGPFPQYGHKPAVDKGPRALGLVQLSPKEGKGRLIPIVIMMDGKFYDAGSYKATPVPMALDFDTVYEAFRSGVSQGVFTITQPGQLNHVWIAEGKWLPAGSKALEKRKKYAPPVIEDDDKGGPPVLHRRVPKSDDDSGSDTKNKDKSNDQQKPSTPSASPTAAPTASAPTTPDTAKAPAPPPEAPKRSASDSDENISDPNRPRLRRGKPDLSARREPFTTFDALTDTTSDAASGAGKADAKTAKDSAASSPPQIVSFPAISDAGGPDPRPYTYDVKPAEEAIYRNKMLDLATVQLAAQTSAATKEAPAGKKTSKSKSAGKSADKSAVTAPKPAFDDVKLRIFDLSNSNEPVLVLSARTQPPAPASGNDGQSLQQQSVQPLIQQPQEITLIARTNLEGELRKLFFSQTDSRHLDMTPRMELIDAVDADGDGRGELLFRRTFEDGSAYAIYRVTADGLWPLFEGTP
jgi:hypothetical protein